MITPYYEDKKSGITIYNCDCNLIIDQLPKVDLVLTDPPYGISYITNRRKCGDKLKCKILNDDDLSNIKNAFEKSLNILKNDRHWYCFGSTKTIFQSEDILKKYKNILVWDKGNMGTAGDLKCGFAECCELIYFGMKGRRELIGSRPRSIIRMDWSTNCDPVHPTVKPIKLLQKIIQWSTFEDEIVLDPFMGSGTTLSASKNLKRKSIGIEMDERYCEIAVNRLRQEILL